MESEEFNWTRLGDVVASVLGAVAPERVDDASRTPKEAEV